MPKKRAFVNVPVEPSIKSRLLRVAKDEDRSLAAIARRAITAELDKVEGKAA